MSNFQWKKFEDVHKRLDDRISITSGGALGFPKRFRDVHIGNAMYALLFYDATQRVIGVCFQVEETDKAKLRVSHSGEYGSSVNARTFLNFNHIDIAAQIGKYEWEEDDYEGKKMYVIHLDKVIKSKSGVIETKTEPDASKEAGASTTPQA